MRKFLGILLMMPLLGTIIGAFISAGVLTIKGVIAFLMALILYACFIIGVVMITEGERK